MGGSPLASGRGAGGGNWSKTEIVFREGHCEGQQLKSKL